MATSGSINFALNRNQIIVQAMRHAWILGVGEDPSADETSDASESLNMMLKAMQADGLNLFTRKHISIILEKNKHKYTVGTDHITASYTTTEVKTAAIAGATSIDVDSTTGMSASDYICIELDDGTLHCTTVSSITDSDTVVIASGLASAAAVDNRVYFYTTKADRPLRLIQAVRRDSSNNDTPITPISQQEYWALSNKTYDGPVSQIYYDPQLTGVFYLWPESDDVTDTIEMVVHKAFDDMDDGANTLDFPSEWTEAVVLGLAARLAQKSGMPTKHVQSLLFMAEEAKRNVRAFDVENSSVFFSPE